MSVHPTSVVEDGAVVGAGVEIGPFCHVGGRAILEEGVRLRSHISVSGVTRIGARCDLYPGVAVGGEARSAAMISPTGGWKSAPIACCAKWFRCMSAAARAAG